jgi:hypothetical protein
MIASLPVNLVLCFKGNKSVYCCTYITEEKIQGKIEVTGRLGRRRRKLLDDLKETILSFERGSSGSHYVESSRWKRLWTCRKTDYKMNIYIYIYIIVRFEHRGLMGHLLWEI